MALYEYGINLELGGYDKFLNQAGTIDRTLINLGNQIKETADKIAGVTFGNFKVDLSALKDIDGRTLNSKATAIVNFGNAYNSLGKAIATVNPDTIAALNKAFSGGAQVETIAKKAEALGEFVKAAKKFQDMPDLGSKATQVKELLEAFSASQKISDFSKFADIGKQVASLVSAFQRIGKVEFNPNITRNLQILTDVLSKLGGNVAQQVISVIPQVAEAFRKLADAFRAFTRGNAGAQLPAVLAGVTTTIRTLIVEIGKLQTSGNFTGITTGITQLATAFRELGVAVRTFASSDQSGQGFANIGININKTLLAFEQLIQAFKQNKFQGDIQQAVAPAVATLNSLGSAFESLGRKKGFEKFPETIRLINEGINNLNVKALQELGEKIRSAVPALEQLAAVAKTITTVNTQMGRSFFAVAKEKTTDTAANRQLLASYIQLAASIANILPLIRSLLPSFSQLASGIKTVAVAFLSLPFQTFSAGMAALKAIFISFPTKALEVGINAVSTAFKLLATAIAIPYNLLRTIGVYFNKLNAELRLVQTGLTIVLAPFKLLGSILSSIIGLISSVAAAFGRLFTAISPFSKAAAESAKRLKETHSASAQVTTAIAGTSSALSEGTARLQTYNNEVSKTSRFARIAVGGLQLFAGALVAKGVTTAVARLVNAHIAFKTLDTLSRAAAAGMQVFRNALTSIVGEAFNAAAEFQKLQLSISVLLGREQVRANPGMFKDTLEAARAMTGEADKLLEKFQLLAIASPFTTTDIANGFRMAQVYGFTSQEAEKLTGVVVDTASALGLAGHEISGIIVPLGQMKQASRATLQDLKQLSERGVPVFEILQKAISKANGGIEVTSAEVRDLISEGLIEANFAVNAIVESLGTDFKNAASAATTSLSGLLSTAQDLKGNILREFFTPIFNAVLFAQKEGDFALADLLSLENIKGSIAIAKQYGQTVAVGIGQTFQNIITIVRAFFAVITAIPTPILKAVLAAGKFIATVLTLTLGLGALSAVLGALATTFFVFFNPVSLAIGVIVALAASVTVNTNTITAAIADLLNSFNQLPQFFNILSDQLTLFFETGKSSAGAFDGLSTTLSTLGNVLFSTLGVLKEFGDGLIFAFNSFVATGKVSTEGFKNLPGILKFAAESVAVLINALSGFVQFFLSIPATIAGASNSITTTLGGLLASFVDWGANIVQSFADGISGTVGLIGQAVQAIGDVLTFWLAPGSPPAIAPDIDKWGAYAALEFTNGFVDSFLTSLGEGFVSIGAAFVTLLTGTFVNTIGSAIITVSGIVKAFTSIFVGVGTQVYLSVKAIIDVIQVLADSTLSVKEKIQGALNVIGFYFVDTFRNIATVLSGIVQGIFISLSGLATFIVGEFVVAFLAIGKVAPIFNTVASNITNFVRKADGDIRTFGNGIVEFVSNVFVNVTNYGYALVQNFANGMVSAVSLVADALSQIGAMISYWLAPGSPPRLLPDIDDWGTDAANEFVQGFSSADLDAIGDFGDAVSEIIKSQGVEGIDVKDIVETFAGGLTNVTAGGDFGQENLDKIHFLAQAAGTDVAILTEKYVDLIKEQQSLNAVTQQYDSALKEAQGSLDAITSSQGVEANQAKVEQLQNALNNTLLTQNERTRLQTQIQKLQAETRVKQLEAEKNAQERNVNSAQAAIDLQKKQLNLADKFDTTGTTTALTSASDNLATEKAGKIQDKLADSVLKYKLQVADTAGKLAIMREELKKVKVGSEEYYEILTEIDQLEKQLARERESGALGKKAGLLDKFGDLSAEGVFGGLTGPNGIGSVTTKVTETVNATTKKIEELKSNIQSKFATIRDTIQGFVTKIQTLYQTWIVNNDAVKGSIAALGVAFAGVKIIGFISSIGSALLLLSNPITATAAAIVGLASAFTYFSIAGGTGILETLEVLKGKFVSFFTTLTANFSIGDSAASFGNSILNFFQGIATFFQTGLTVFVTSMQALFVTKWQLFLSTISAIFADTGIAANGLIQAATAVLTLIDTNFIDPITGAFENNETLLGKVAGALMAFYTGVFNSISSLSGSAHEFDVAAFVNGIFDTSAIAQAVESNVNEAVGVIIPALKENFDFSEALITLGNGIKVALDGLKVIVDSIPGIFQSIIDGYNNFTSIFSGEGTGIFANIINQNKEAFAEFITEVTSPEFISGLQNIGAVLGIVAGAIAALAAVIIDVAIIGILKNIGDVVIEVGAGIDILKQAFQAFLAGDIAGGFAKTFEGVQTILEGIFGNIADVISDAVKALLEFFNIDTSGTLGVIIDIVADAIVSFLSFRGVISAVSKGWTILLNVIRPVTIAFGAWLASLFQAKAPTLLYFKILNGAEKVFGLLKNGLQTIIATIFAVTVALRNNQITFSQVFDAIKNVVGNTLGSIGTTISDKFVAIKDGFINSFATFVTTNPLASEGIKLAINFLASFTTNLKDNVAQIGTTIIDGLALVNLAATALTLIETLGFDSETVVSKLTESLQSMFTSAVAGIKEVTFNIADALIVSEDEKQKLADKIAGFLPNVDAIFGEGATKKTALSIADFITFDEAEFVAVQNAFQGIIDTLSKFATLVGIPEAFTTTLQAVKSLLAGDATFAETLKKVWDAFAGIINTLLIQFTNPFGPIVVAIQGLKEPITVVSDGFTAIKDTIQGLLDIDLSGFSNIFKPITDTFASIQSKIDGLTGAFTGLNVIPGINIGSAEVTGGDEVQQKIKSAVGNQTLNLQQKLELITDDTNLSEQSAKLLNAFKTSYEENSGTFATDFAAINKDLLEQGFTAADIENLATGFGKEVPAGLAAGMADETGELDRATRGLATNLLSDIASELGIQSPSTKARDEIGIPFVEGIAAGLADYSAVIEAVTQIALEMIDATNGVLIANIDKIDLAKALFSLNESSVTVTKTAMDEIYIKMNETFTEISSETIPVFVETTTEQFVDMFDALLDLADEFSTEFLNVLRRLSDATLKTLDALVKNITDKTSSFKDAGRKLGEALVAGVVEGITDNISSIIGAVLNLFGEEGTESTEVFERAKESGIKIGKEFTIGMAEGMIAPSVLQAIREAAQQVVEEAQNAAESAAGIASPSTLFRDRVGKNITAGITLGMVDGTEDLVDGMTNVINRIYREAQQNVGVQFVAGIVSGIAQQQTALTNTVTSLMNTSVTTAKTALDIHSPSRVTREGIGVPYVNGIMVALENGRGKLSKVAGNLLSVLPENQEFKYSVLGQLAQPVELEYNNLLTSLPSLYQHVAMQRGDMPGLSGTLPISSYINQRVAFNPFTNIPVPTSYDASRNMMMQNVSHMINNSRNATTSTQNFYYTMHVTTTPESSTKVRRNFDMMRLGRRI